jgi:hypothetical protein
VGIDTPDAMVIAPAGTGLARWLSLLDGTRGVLELQRSGARLGLDSVRLRQVLRQLAAARLLVGEPDRPMGADRAPASIGRVRLIGAGRLGRAIARSLSRVDLAVLELVDDEPVDRSLYPRHGGLGKQAMALQAELIADRARAGRGAYGPPFDLPAPLVTAGPPWSAICAETSVERAGPGGHRNGGSDPRWQLTPDLTVLATDRLEVERMFTDALLRADQPHVIARTTSDGVVVGPLVLPGTTPCLRCTDLVRCDLDPDWPGLLSQLNRTTGSLTESLLGWAAGVTVMQVVTLLSALDDPTRSWPESAGATLELGRDGIQRRRSWPRHPSCGCAWTIAATPGLPVFADDAGLAAG